MEPRRWRLALSLRARCVHLLELGDEGGELLAGGFVAVEDGLDLGVGHAAGAADDAFADLVAEDFAAGVDLHEAGEDEAVFVGAQAAHA